MIIYRDIATSNKDEIVSDVFKILDVGDGLWEVDCRMITKGAENFVLDGANPSAEGEDADEGGDGGQSERVLDIADQFRLNSIPKPTKKAYQSELKGYLKKVLTAMKEKGEPDEKLKAFQADAPKAMKKILANWDDYDVYTGESMEENSMWVLINYREDGVTPYATVWKWGLEEYKV